MCEYLNGQGAIPKLPKAREGFGWLYLPHTDNQTLKKKKLKKKKINRYRIEGGGISKMYKRSNKFNNEQKKFCKINFLFLYLQNNLIAQGRGLDYLK